MAENELLDLKNGPRWDRLRRLIKADAPTIDLVEVCVESIFSEVKWLKKKSGRRLRSNWPGLRVAGVSSRLADWFRRHCPCSRSGSLARYSAALPG